MSVTKETTWMVSIPVVGCSNYQSGHWLIVMLPDEPNRYDLWDLASDYEDEHCGRYFSLAEAKSMAISLDEYLDKDRSL